jgi:hypothetical protein
VLADNGILKVEGTTVSLVEQLDPDQIASLLSPSTSVPSVRVDFASRMHRGARIQPNGKRYASGSLKETVNAAPSRAVNMATNSTWTTFGPRSGAVVRVHWRHVRSSSFPPSEPTAGSR